MDNTGRSHHEQQVWELHEMIDSLLSALRGVVVALTDQRACEHIAMYRAELAARECLDQFEPETPGDIHGETFHAIAEPKETEPTKH